MRNFISCPVALSISSSGHCGALFVIVLKHQPDVWCQQVVHFVPLFKRKRNHVSFLIDSSRDAVYQVLQIVLTNGVSHKSLPPLTRFPMVIWKYVLPLLQFEIFVNGWVIYMFFVDGSMRLTPCRLIATSRLSGRLVSPFCCMKERFVRIRIRINQLAHLRVESLCNLPWLRRKPTQKLAICAQYSETQF